MSLSTLLWQLLVASIAARVVDAKAVFGHYLVGNILEAHLQQDIDDARAMGLDGFGLNVGDPTEFYIPTALGALFSYAASTNFKLYISLDVLASGEACYSGSTCCNGPNDYTAMLQNYTQSSAYYLGPNGKPMVSTFSSGGFNMTLWQAWRSSLGFDIYFIPDFDDTNGYYQATQRWWNYWGTLVDGLTSWEAAWPRRTYGLPGGVFSGDISEDQLVLKAANARKKGYMMTLSALSYKDAYGVNLYRAGDLNLPIRMQNILAMTPQPTFVQVATWNDGPESHYIGTVWPEQNSDGQPNVYVSQARFPHQGWQPLLTSFISAWKANLPSSSMTPPTGTPAVGALWYKTILQNAKCPKDGTFLFFDEPDGFSTGRDGLYWAIIISPSSTGMKIRIRSNGIILSTSNVNAGLHSGTVFGIKPGPQTMELLDSSGKVVMSSVLGQCITSGCPDTIYNMNYQVLGLVPGGAGGKGLCTVATGTIGVSSMTSSSGAAKTGTGMSTIVKITTTTIAVSRSGVVSATVKGSTATVTATGSASVVAAAPGRQLKKSAVLMR